MVKESQPPQGEDDGHCPQPFLCPLSHVGTGVAVRIKQLSASPEVTHRLREMGFCEEQKIKLLSRQTQLDLPGVQCPPGHQHRGWPKRSWSSNFPAKRSLDMPRRKSTADFPQARRRRPPSVKSICRPDQRGRLLEMGLLVGHAGATRALCPAGRPGGDQVARLSFDAAPPGGRTDSGPGRQLNAWRTSIADPPASKAQLRLCLNLEGAAVRPLRNRGGLLPMSF